MKTLTMNSYQHANLLWLLELIYSCKDQDLNCLNTGDWVGELCQQLNPPPTHQPNISAEQHFEMKERMKKYEQK